MHIFIGGISYSATDDDLYDAISGIIDISAAWVVEDDRTGSSKGFGFFECESCGSELLEKLNSLVVDGRKIKASVADESSRYITGRGNSK